MRGAISTTRRTALRLWCESHISQTITAVCFGFHSTVRVSTSNSPLSRSEGTRRRWVSRKLFGLSPVASAPLQGSSARVQARMVRARSFVDINRLLGGQRNPSPQPPPRNGEGEPEQHSLLLPLSVAGRGLGGGVLTQALNAVSVCCVSNRSAGQDWLPAAARGTACRSRTVSHATRRRPGSPRAPTPAPCAITPQPWRTGPPRRRPPPVYPSRCRPSTRSIHRRGCRVRSRVPRRETRRADRSPAPTRADCDGTARSAPVPPPCRSPPARRDTPHDRCRRGRGSNGRRRSW